MTNFKRGRNNGLYLDIHRLTISISYIHDSKYEQSNRRTAKRDRATQNQN